MCSRAASGLVLALIVLAGAPAWARQRAVRQVLDARTSVLDLLQDRDGVFWLGTVQGLQRFDGRELHPVHPERLNRPVENLWQAPDGALWVNEQGGALFRLQGDRVEPVLDDDGEPMAQVASVAFDRTGRPWLVAAGRVRRRGEDGRWNDVIATALGGDRPRLLHAASDGTMIVATLYALWRVVDDTHAERLAELFLPEAMMSDPDGTLWVADGHFITRVRGGQATRVLGIASLGPSAIRFGDLVRRGDSIWVVYDYGLAVIHADDTTEVVQFAAAPWTARSDLLVDEEGSLWVGHPRGLYLFPEPDTVWWTDRDGLPLSEGRFVTRDDEGVWMSAWSGAALVRPPGHEPRVEPVTRPLVREQLCAAGEGHIWLTPGEGMMERQDGRFVMYPFTPPGGGARCDRAADGTLWILESVRLIHTGGPGVAPVELPHPWGEEKIAPAGLLVDSHGQLWLASENAICVGDGDGRGPWSCTPTPGRPGALARSLIETDEGVIWLAVRGEGVYRFADGRWVFVDDSAALPTRWIQSLRHSPRGGIWVLGQSFAERVLPGEDGVSWQVVEQLSQWHGLGSPGAADLLEEPDGRLWLVGPDAPLIEVPPQARFAEPRAPRVLQVSARADGRVLTGDDALHLPSGVQRLDLDFAALSYREPQRLRYRMRHGEGAPWSAASESGSFSLLGVAPGRYHLEVAASLDGEHWSDVPARYDFGALAPWYSSRWAWAGFTALGAIALYLAHVARTQVLLRLERQRLRIARDLHDEVGSGLGSLGILSEVMNQEDVAEHERRELGERIHGTALALSTSLQDIVWSLRVGSERLAALPAHLRERGAALLADRPGAFRTELPAVLPDWRLALPVRRHVQLIALEALHNAARHADARRVTLGLAPGARGVVHMWIEDDGCGLGASRRPGGSGMGMASMQKRARELRGELKVRSSPGQGTRIELWFHVDGQPTSAP